MTIDAQKLLDVFKDCLFKSEEVVGSVPPSDAVIVEGITHKFGFHAERLESHRVEIQA